jgi:phosphohistidine phosphatase SixA
MDDDIERAARTLAETAESPVRVILSARTRAEKHAPGVISTSS